jgi:enediyne biosynthesis protein E4
MSADMSKGIFDAGMITGAAWADMDGDKKKELIITGEWMAPKIFKYQQGHFEEIKTNLFDKNGLWQTVLAADLNSDGREDLILGNMGENFYLHPDEKHPVKIWMNDFDQNGQVDKVITRTVDGKDKPVFMKGELESALPFLKKQNLRHAEFATKSVQELFANGQLDRAVVKSINYSSSCIAFNNGNGSFTLSALPPAIQFSLLKCVKAVDINKDGFTDLAMGGNEFNFQPQLGRLDASNGDVLINDGKGNFSVANHSGLALKGQVRDIVQVRGNNGIYLLFLQNNEKPVLYKTNLKK